MLPENKGPSEITLSLEGATVGSLKSVSTVVSPGTSTGRWPSWDSLERSGEVTLAADNLLAKATDLLNNWDDRLHRYTVHHESYYFPRGDRLPKKKRLRKKWIKNYVRKTVYVNIKINMEKDR